MLTIHNSKPSSTPINTSHSLLEQSSSLNSVSPSLLLPENLQKHRDFNSRSNSKPSWMNGRLLLLTKEVLLAQDIITKLKSISETNAEKDSLLSKDNTIDSLISIISSSKHSLISINILAMLNFE